MAFEIYRSQIITQFLGKRSTATFFFFVDNTSLIHPFRVASGINFEYAAISDWLFHYAQMITEHAYIRLMATRRFHPTPGPSCYVKYGPTQNPGLAVGQMGDNFICAKLQWHSEDDTFGKLMNRIGPISEGATFGNGWLPVFELAAGAFVGEHITTHTLDIGLACRGCRNEFGTLDCLIQSATLHWPPSRQKNRRSEP